MKKWSSIIAAIALVSVLGTGVAVGDTVDPTQTAIVSSVQPMSSAEIATELPQSVFLASVEGQAYAAANPGYATKAVAAAGTSTHCWGAKYSRAGVNSVGVTLWKIWNHTAWCGVPFDHIVQGSVYGHTDTYTCCAWSTSGKAWNKRTVSTKQRTTDGYAHVSFSINGNTIQSEDIHVTMDIFANGANNWGKW